MSKVEEKGGMKVLKEFKRLKGKEVKIVYRESESKEPYISEGRLVDASKSFVVVRAKNGLVHFIGTQSIVRLSERFSESVGGD